MLIGGRNERAGWRIKIFVQRLGDPAPSWRLLPPPSSFDSLTFTSARALARKHANDGVRARVVSPDGDESDDVPAEKRSRKRRSRM